MVQLLAAAATSASELQAGVEAVLTDGGRAICGPPSRRERYDDLGTTPALVAAEALKLSCTHYKSSMLTALKSLGARGVQVLVCSDEVVTIWLHQQGRQQAAVRDSLRYDNEGASGSANSSGRSSREGSGSSSNINSGRSSREGASSGSSQWPALDRESFEVYVAAFMAFRDESDLFGEWSADSQLHSIAVENMVYGIRSAFEAEIPGPWQQQQQQSDDWLYDAPAVTRMPDDMFETMLSECSSVLALRELRNTSLAHPFDRADPAMRQQLFELFREEVAEGGRVVSKMRHMAAAAIGHVESMLAHAEVKQRESKRVEPGRMRVRDLSLP